MSHHHPSGRPTQPRRIRSHRAPLALPVLLVLALAGCGDDDDAAADADAVHVTLTDTASAQSVESDLSTFEAGVPYHFVVENTGSLAHELMIIEPIEPGTMDMEEMDEMALYVIEEDDLEAGATVEFDYTFPDSAVGQSLEFACYLAGHYELGMHAPITVEG